MLNAEWRFSLYLPRWSLGVAERPEIKPFEPEPVSTGVGKAEEDLISL
jgi:hypothetical protein